MIKQAEAKVVPSSSLVAPQANEQAVAEVLQNSCSVNVRIRVS